jgi:hypothetical protein
MGEIHDDVALAGQRPGIGIMRDALRWHFAGAPGATGQHCTGSDRLARHQAPHPPGYSCHSNAHGPL